MIAETQRYSIPKSLLTALFMATLAQGLTTLGHANDTTTNNNASKGSTIANESKAYLESKSKEVDAAVSAQKHEAIANAHDQAASATDSVTETVVHKAKALKNRAEGAVDNAKKTYYNSRSSSHLENIKNEVKE
jgi:hypothetical protein